MNQCMPTEQGQNWSLSGYALCPIRSELNMEVEAKRDNVEEGVSMPSFICCSPRTQSIGSWELRL